MPKELPESDRAPASARRRKVRVALGVLGLLAVAGALAELALRARVPRNGFTPFRTSAIEGVAWELRPGFRTLYRGVEVAINSQGFRGAEFEPPIAGVRRIALVGDSMTFGNGVELEETLAACLERRFAEAGMRAQVLNCGVPGFNADDTARLLEARIQALAPDTVVYVYFSNDAEQAEQVDAIPPDAVIDAFAGFPLRSAFLEWTKTMAKLAAQRAGFRTARRTAEWSAREFELGRDVFVGALRRMQAACARAGAELHVVAYPFLCLPGMDPFGPIDAGAERECRALGLPFRRLAEAFDPQEDLTRYWANAFDHHPDGAANERVAAFLVENVLADGGR